MITKEVIMMRDKPLLVLSSFFFFFKTGIYIAQSLIHRECFLGLIECVSIMHNLIQKSLACMDFNLGTSGYNSGLLLLLYDMNINHLLWCFSAGS